ncbi:MAG: hypothetical protein Q9N34_04850 [Aquificota bacterium]|nr:hypothetical protein [Aquificota bacterium]
MRELFLIAKGELEPEDEGQRTYRELVFNRCLHDAIFTTFSLSSFVSEEDLPSSSASLKERRGSPFAPEPVG